MFKKVLDANGQKAWQKLENFSNIGLLAGGTALALQSGHRKSIDFDFFCPEEIEPKLILKVKKVFGKIKILVNSTDELTFLTPEGVKVTFLYYPFRFLYKPKIINKIRVLDKKDIASAKAYTLNRRATIKDYIDLYFLIKNGFAIQKIIKNSKKIYGDLFSEKLFLAQLLYLDDIDKNELNNIKFITKEKINIKILKKYFKNIIKI